MFADDCVIYKNILRNDDINFVQNDMNTLDIWQEKRQMKFNASKCFLLRITHKTNPITASYKLGNEILQDTKSHSYLGEEITNDLKWNSHINNICAKVNRQLGFIRRNLASCPQSLKSQAYTTLVRKI